MNINYAKVLEEILKENKNKKVLLHSCCAPCSSYVLSYLTNYLDITVLYYNPNISPKEEYELRKQEQIKIINNLDKKNKIDYIDCDWENEKYEEVIKGLEHEPERGSRCTKCFYLRLEKTAKMAKKLGYYYFCTTLTLSPYKNAKLLNEIGFELEKKYNVKYLPSDFKKNDGYKQSIQLSKKYDLYRQDYCGCKYSKRKEEVL